MAVKQTAGRDSLGEFAPKFAQLNDDVLFGEVWSREDKLSARDRSLVTVVALMAQGLVDSSFQYHLTTARKNGITRQEIAEILTHAAFYAGWPKAWAAFRMAKDCLLYTSFPAWKRLLFSLAGARYDSAARKQGKEYRFLFVREDGAQLRTITQIVERQQIMPRIDPHRFTLETARDALELVAEGHPDGKVILQIS